MTKRFGAGLLVVVAAAIFFIETHHQIKQFRLYTFSLAFLFLAVVTIIVPARVRSLFLVLASLAFGVTVIEGVAITQEPRILPQYTTNSPGAQIRVPGIGWDNGVAGVYHGHSYNPYTGRVVFDVDYTIDVDHDRLTKSANSGRPVVFLGDSLTFGQGIEDVDTLPQRFADLLGRRRKTLNLAVDAYSPAQVLYEFQTGYRDKVIGKDPLVFVMLTGVFHAVRTSCREEWVRTAPRYVERAGKLVYVGDCLKGIDLAVHRFLKDTAIYRAFVEPRLPRETRDDIKTYIDIVAETVRLAKEKYGAETLVPYTGGPVDTPRATTTSKSTQSRIWEPT